MNEDKKKITIEVEPILATTTIGLLRGIFPSIIEQLERQAQDAGADLKFNNVDAMQSVLDEIYERCITETDIREHAQGFINSNFMSN